MITGECLQTYLNICSEIPNLSVLLLILYTHTNLPQIMGLFYLETPPKYFTCSETQSVLVHSHPENGLSAGCKLAPAFLRICGWKPILL